MTWCCPCRCHCTLLFHREGHCARGCCPFPPISILENSQQPVSSLVRLTTYKHQARDHHRFTLCLLLPRQRTVFELTVHRFSLKEESRLGFTLPISGKCLFVELINTAHHRTRSGHRTLRSTRLISNNNRGEMGAQSPNTQNAVLSFSAEPRLAMPREKNKILCKRGIAFDGSWTERWYVAT